MTNDGIFYERYKIAGDTSDKWRWKYNNNQKKKELRAFAEEMLSSLKRNGLIGEDVTLK